MVLVPLPREREKSGITCAMDQYLRVFLGAGVVWRYRQWRPFC